MSVGRTMRPMMCCIALCERPAVHWMRKRTGRSETKDFKEAMCNQCHRAYLRGVQWAERHSQTKIYKRGYEQALDDNHILHGEDARRFLDEVEHPKKPTKKQQKFIDECCAIFEKVEKRI